MRVTIQVYATLGNTANPYRPKVLGVHSTNREAEDQRIMNLPEHPEASVQGPIDLIIYIPISAQ